MKEINFMKKICVLFLIIMFNSCNNKDILNIGHRGARGHVAENTLESIQKAIDLGVDGVEIDVFRCASGEIVVFHDKKIDRLTSSIGFIEEMTLDSLNDVLIDGKYKIPTLEQVLELINGNILLNVELKGKNTAKQTALILKNFISNTEWEVNQLIVSSFDWNELTIFKDENTDIPIGILNEKNTLNEVLDIAIKLDAVAIHPNFASLNKEIVNTIHDAGFKIYSWTINKPEEINKAINFGIDGIITDFPDRIP